MIISFEESVRLTFQTEPLYLRKAFIDPVRYIRLLEKDGPQGGNTNVIGFATLRSSDSPNILWTMSQTVVALTSKRYL